MGTATAVNMNTVKYTAIPGQLLWQQQGRCRAANKQSLIMWDGSSRCAMTRIFNWQPPLPSMCMCSLPQSTQQTCHAGQMLTVTSLNGAKGQGANHDTTNNLAVSPAA
jgi:hypothetical protein